MAAEASAARTRTAVLISGRGSNLAALIAACARPGARAEIALVISNRPDAAGLEHARAAGIPVEIIDHRRHLAREEFDRYLSTSLEHADITLICLAGFMRVLSAWFTERWRDRLLNMHPSLLPAFLGLDTHRRALAAGVRFSGCTVHFVRADLDAGPIIVQGVVPVHPDDTPESLAARVLAAEHRCYPLALELVASGRVRVEGERVVIGGAATPDVLVINPAPG
ncbi:MAG: phosphoribosylglycinamide formyltransferase [Geminicoccaceae bacterium]